ncbi:MAG: (2Fe-2S) ferredoxin domain-containing protein, partial [Verrucomicrobiota bacterium]
MNDDLNKAVETLGLEKYQRHIFLCADQTEPKCC